MKVLSAGVRRSPGPLFMPIGAGALAALVLRDLATTFLA